VSRKVCQSGGRTYSEPIFRLCGSIAFQKPKKRSCRSTTLQSEHWEGKSPDEPIGRTNFQVSRKVCQSGGRTSGEPIFRLCKSTTLQKPKKRSCRSTTLQSEHWEGESPDEPIGRANFQVNRKVCQSGGRTSGEPIFRLCGSTTFQKPKKRSCRSTTLQSEHWEGESPDEPIGRANLLVSRFFGCAGAQPSRNQKKRSCRSTTLQSEHWEGEPPGEPKIRLGGKTSGKPIFATKCVIIELAGGT